MMSSEVETVKLNRVLLGYEVGTGAEVTLPLHHLVVTGLTRLSGKTTTLEALIHRCGLKAIAFRTKRGEIGFEGAARIPPFHVAGERWGDWQYVESILEATMKQRMKFERSWIIRLCKGAREPRDVYDNVVRRLEGGKPLRGIDESICINLRAYLEIVLPQLEASRLTRRLDYGPGVSVMDLDGFTVEMQALVIRSVLEEVLLHRRDTIVVLPEAWNFLPQRRGSPVKWAAEKFIREGAVLGNLLWIDSQDMANIDKGILKSVGVWLLGRQQETNEVEHVLKQIPLAKRARPKAEEIMRLGIGEFYAAFEDQVRKVYVRPTWATNEVWVRRVARGEATVEQLSKVYEHPERKEEVEDTDEKEREGYEATIKGLKAAGTELRQGLVDMSKDLSNAHEKAHLARERVKELEAALKKGAIAALDDLEEAIKKAPTRRVVQVGPVNIEAQEREVAVRFSTEPREFKTNVTKGRIMFVLLKDLGNAPSTMGELSSALLERGWNIGNNTLSPELGKLVSDGDLVKEAPEGEKKGIRYRVPGKVKVRVEEA